MITNENKYLIDDLGNYLFVAPIDAVAFSYFFGTLGGGQRPSTADFSLLTEVEDSEYSTTDPLTITFGGSVGWQVFAEPVSAVTRTEWQAGNNNQGAIGGVPTKNGNLWPDPILQEFEGFWYKVYITNYRTKFFEPVTVT